MPETNQTIVTFDRVSLRFGDTLALRNVSFRLDTGETRIILGAAGSGKTSLLKTVIGLLQPDSGSVKLFGDEVSGREEHDLYSLRSKAGFLFQEGGLFDSLTIGENVAYPLLNQQTAAGELGLEEVEKRVRDALRFVELEQTFDKFPAELSGGMRRRVGIARAIVTEPPLVLYDSPTAGLDPITANTIMALIAKERDTRDTAALIVTHRYQDGELMANFRYNPQKEELVPVDPDEQFGRRRTRTRFFVMREGEIVFTGTRQELESQSDPYIKRFVKH